MSVDATQCDSASESLDQIPGGADALVGAGAGDVLPGHVRPIALRPGHPCLLAISSRAFYSRVANAGEQPDLRSMILDAGGALSAAESSR